MTDTDLPNFSDANDAPGAMPMRIYAVVAGDTLAKIAEHVYGDASLWTLIFEANKDILRDPSRVRPGQKLKIPPRLG